jgi:hypothetical protein
MHEPQLQSRPGPARQRACERAEQDVVGVRALSSRIAAGLGTTVLLGAAAFALDPIRSAHACTICHDASAVELRALLLGREGLRDLLALAAPIVPLISAVAIVRGIAPWLMGGRPDA